MTVQASSPHARDFGTIFYLTLTDGGVAVDLSAATATSFIFKAPDNDCSSVQATFVTNGTDGRLKYTFPAGFLSLPGKWQAQAKVVMPTGTWYSDSVFFHVSTNLCRLA